MKHKTLDLPVWPSLQAAAEDIKAKAETLTHEDMMARIAKLEGLTNDAYRRVEIEGVLYDFAYSKVPMRRSGCLSHILTVYTPACIMPEEEVARRIAEAVLGPKCFENSMPNAFGTPRRCYLLIEPETQTSK